jgi:TctA family transporter
MYGGAIPAILINTPGTAVNALTTYDGYPMTKQGQDHRALSLEHVLKRACDHYSHSPDEIAAPKIVMAR